MLVKRVITSVLGILLLVAAVWFEAPLPWLAFLIVPWGLIAAYEFYRMVNYAVTLPLIIFGLFWVLLFILSPFCDYRYTVAILTASAALLPAVWLLARPWQLHRSAAWIWTVTGIIYIGWLLSHYLALREVPDYGRNWVFFTLFVTFASDSAAFFVGRGLGRHRLAPRISPNKTWEGSVGGLAGAVIIGMLFTLPTPFQLPLSYGQAVLLGLLVSVAGQIGDLLESWFKRRTGVKDSGALLPGHGGALDRLDSVILAGPVVYYYVMIFMTG
jgi:phosphatidate cytidylyltransferase